MKTIVIVALAALSAAVTAQIIDKNESGGGSLWSDDVPNPFVDRTARRIGDLVTIVISESSAARFAADTSLTKSDSTSVTPPVIGGFLGQLIRPLSTGASSSNAGTGETTATGRVSFRLTAVVREVLANGNLVLEGARTVTVNREVQTFKLSGVVRRDDVLANNTVMSESIADAEIRVQGRGGIYDRQRRGILTRLLDWLF
jgi:flagellar L-ring protein precursor FlgH